ncbi:histidine kinase [Nonomuraea ferruginea]|uniref:histidine kinase n=1 Tax=Nonomuraea ferruginea TaxID=46174 RepID=A0ABT4T4W6_9ACTN|nr:histidine kinase [Nonomuraea ferruginea]MDA0644314.1 histidine kinase [Nonomuraea ferruginea]
MNESHRLFVGPLGRSQLIALDLVAALSFVLVALTATVNAAGIPPWARLAIPLGLGLPLALRRVWPLPVFLFTVALAVTAVVSGAFSFAYVSPAYALYLVAVAEDRGSWLPTSTIGVLALLTGVGLVMVGGVPHPEGPAWLLGVDEALFGIAALGGAWTVGRAVRERRMYAMRHAERLAEQAVAEERLRIARELHDVVTHNVGLIAVKAGVANHVLATKPEEAHDALRVIESASRNALVEMRHLLGVLRSSESPARGPAPGLRGLTGLAEQARQAGVDVELDVSMARGQGGPEMRESATGSMFREAQQTRAGETSGLAAGQAEGGTGLSTLSGSSSTRQSGSSFGTRDGSSFGTRDGSSFATQDGASFTNESGSSFTTHGGSRFPTEGGSRFTAQGQSGPAEASGSGPRTESGAGLAVEEGDDGASTQDMPSGEEASVFGRRSMTGRQSAEKVGVVEGGAPAQPVRGRLPEGVELSVYRIVQEALTNVVKHAAPARCRVSVVDDGRAVRIEVSDDGPGHRTMTGRGPGHGLIGMRERVMMYGGTFEAGGMIGQGFRVSASLPYGSDS